MIEAFWHPDHPEMEAWKAAPPADLVAHLVEHNHLEARLDMARMENQVLFRRVMDGDV